jgi:hypothetical protein
MMLKRGSGGEGLLVRAEPLEWAEAIKMMLVSKGVRVSELVGSSRYIAALPSLN